MIGVLSEHDLLRRKPYLLVFLFLAFSFLSSSLKAQKESKVNRVIALAPHSVELLYLLGVGDRIIATTSFADYPEEAKSITVVGGYNGIQIEKVLSLQPDLVIAWEDGNKLDDIVQLERLGLNVHRSKTKVLKEIATEILNMGELLGIQDKAKQEAERFLSGLSELTSQYKDKKPVRFFYQLWSEPLRAMAAKSWINEMLVGCGGVNIFDASIGDYPQVSIENVIEKMPEVIIIPSHHGHGLGEGDFWQEWPEIPAVSNQHIFYVNGDLLHRFSVRTLQGMQQICDRLEAVRRHQ